MQPLTEPALLLVLAAAAAHATWNLMAKQARGGTAFVWLSTLANVVIWSPAAAVTLLLGHHALPLAGIALVGVSGVLHTGYWLSLNRGYRDGDLSVVYPLARGCGALFAAIAAVLLLAERPTLLGSIGAAVIVGAVLLLAGDPRAILRPGRAAGLEWAGLTAVFIAGYTLWDSRAVGPHHLEPIFFYWAVNVVNVLLITPYVLGRGIPTGLLREHARRAAWIGVLSTLSYVPVLYALAIAPVSFVAPAREVSVLLGAAMGIQILNESDAPRRLVAAAAIIAGVTAFALAY